MVHCLARAACLYDANLTQRAFHRLYDAAFATLRRELPSARIVAPTLAASAARRSPRGLAARPAWRTSSTGLPVIRCMFQN